MPASIFAWFAAMTIFTIVYVISLELIPNDLLWEPLGSPLTGWFIIVVLLTCQLKKESKL